MKYYLIQQETDFNDEGSNYGFMLRRAKNLREIKKSLLHSEYAFPYDRYHGNDWMGFDSEEQYFSTFEIKVITEAEYKVLKKLFGETWGDLRTLEEY